MLIFASIWGFFVFFRLFAQLAIKKKLAQTQINAFELAPFAGCGGWGIPKLSASGMRSPRLALRAWLRALPLRQEERNSNRVTFLIFMQS